MPERYDPHLFRPDADEARVLLKLVVTELATRIEVDLTGSEANLVDLSAGEQQKLRKVCRRLTRDLYVDIRCSRCDETLADHAADSHHIPKFVWREAEFIPKSDVSVT